MCFGRAERHRDRRRTPENTFQNAFRPKHHLAIPAGRVLTRESSGLQTPSHEHQVHSGTLSGVLLAYSGGPVPDSHRLPVRSFSRSNARRACNRKTMFQGAKLQRHCRKSLPLPDFRDLQNGSHTGTEPVGRQESWVASREREATGFRSKEIRTSLPGCWMFPEDLPIIRALPPVPIRSRTGTRWPRIFFRESRTTTTSL